MLKINEKDKKKEMRAWFRGLSPLERAKAMQPYYPKYNITKLEQRNIFKMWKAIPLEAKKGIVEYQLKYGK